jgi:hypothetical protein
MVIENSTSKRGGVVVKLTSKAVSNIPPVETAFFVWRVGEPTRA